MQAGIDARAPFFVTGYGEFHLPFSGKTKYLYSLVFVYKRLIIAGVRVLIVYSTTFISGTVIILLYNETLGTSSLLAVKGESV